MPNDEPRPSVLDDLANELGIRIPQLFEYGGVLPSGCAYSVEFCVDRGDVAIRSVRFGDDSLMLYEDATIGQNAANVSRMPDAADLAAMDWQTITRDAVMSEFVKAHIALGVEGFGGVDAYVAATSTLTLAADAIAGQSYDPPGKNHKWSPQMAERVLSLNAAGGLDRVAEALQVTKRSARRYVTRARDEGYTA